MRSRGRGLEFADPPRSAGRMRCVVFGGGPYVLRLIALMARERGLPAIDWTLVATRPGPLKTVADRARRDMCVTHPEWTVLDTLDPHRALAGADAIIVLVRVGGLGAREWDESFPVRHGLIGDEGLGIGGMANAWRSVPVLDDLARRIRTRAPSAFVFNLSAPLGITTRVFLDHDLATVGICELPQTTRDAFGPRGHGVDLLDYGGLNHLGWFWPRAAAGHALLENAVGLGLVERATYDRFGAAPLSYYYDVYDSEAAMRLGRSRPSGRAQALAQLKEGIHHALLNQPAAVAGRIEERPTPWFEHALVPALAAALRREPHEMFGNLANPTSWAGLPAPAVVEHRLRTDTGLVIGTPPGAPPPRVAEFLVRISASEQLLSRAAHQRDQHLLAEAIAAQPLPIRAARIPEMITDLMSTPGASGAS